MSVFESSFKEAFGAGLSSDAISKILSEAHITNSCPGEGSIERAVDEALNYILFETEWHTVGCKDSPPVPAVDSYAAAAATPAVTEEPSTHLAEFVVVGKRNKKKNKSNDTKQEGAAHPSVNTGSVAVKHYGAFEAIEAVSPKTETENSDIDSRLSPSGDRCSARIVDGLAADTVQHIAEKSPVNHLEDFRVAGKKNQTKHKVTTLAAASKGSVRAEAIATVRSLFPAEVQDFTIVAALEINNFDIAAAVDHIFSSGSSEDTTSGVSALSPEPVRANSRPGGSSRTCGHRDQTVFSLLTDETQLCSFRELQGIFPNEFENWYLLDTLMTYNFSINDAVSHIFEEKGRARMSYGNVVSSGASGQSIKSDGSKGCLIRNIKKSFVVPPITSRENIVLPPKIESNTAQVSNRVAILNLDSFQWTRLPSASDDALNIFVSLNPTLNVKSDPITGRLVFHGVKKKSEAHQSKKSEQILFDFHHSTVKVALEITCSAMLYFSNRKRSRLPSGGSSTGSSSNYVVLQLLFGVGSHSFGGKCVLKLAVCGFLDRRGIVHNTSVSDAFTLVKI